MTNHFIDTHYHLDLYPKPEELANKIESEGIYTIAVTNTPSVFHYTYNISQGKKYIRAAIGFHPELVCSRAVELDIFWTELEKTRYIGEVGLDYSDPNCDKLKQRKVFEAILDKCAQYKNKIISIHCRKSAEDIVSIIGTNYPGKIILHWFTADNKILKKAIEVGCYFSVNYNMTLKNSTSNALVRIPIDRLLTETDGPFVKIGNNVCSPLDIPQIMEKISDLFKMDSEDLKKIIFDNFKQILL